MEFIYNSFEFFKGVIFPLKKNSFKENFLFKSLRWFLHFVLVALIVFFFEIIQKKTVFSRYVRAPFPLLREHWIPVFVFLVYVTIWLSWLLWYLIKKQSEQSPFPDIDDDWNSGLKFTNSKDIDLSTTPVFLTLGVPLLGNNHLLKIYSSSKKQPWIDSIFTGTFEGIFINYQDDCHLGNLEKRLANGFHKSWNVFLEDHYSLINNSLPSEETVIATAQEIQLKSNSAQVVPEVAELKKNKNDDFVSQQEALLASLQNAMAVFQTKKEPDPKIIPESVDQVPLNQIPGNSDNSEGDLGNSNLKDNNFSKKEAPKLYPGFAGDFMTNSRLAYISDKVFELRFPVCPANGIAVVIPIPLMVPENIGLILESAQKDLLYLRDKLELNFPVYVFFTDLDQLPGFQDFFSSLSMEKIKEGFGTNLQVCSENPNPSQVSDHLRSCVSWVMTEWLPKSVYPLLDFSNLNPKTRFGLVNMLNAFSKLEPILSEFSAKLFTPNNQNPLLAGGCYFIATGSDSKSQGFYLQPFEKLIDFQNNVAWLNTAIKKDKFRKILTIISYIFIVGLISATLCLIWFNLL